jgi:hypothetical protein
MLLLQYLSQELHNARVHYMSHLNAHANSKYICMDQDVSLQQHSQSLQQGIASNLPIQPKLDF